jgi:hypothetical protein
MKFNIKNFWVKEEAESEQPSKPILEEVGEPVSLIIRALNEDPDRWEVSQFSGTYTFNDNKTDTYIQYTLLPLNRRHYGLNDISVYRLKDLTVSEKRALDNTLSAFVAADVQRKQREATEEKAKLREEMTERYKESFNAS